MALPGFTAEVSIGPTVQVYRMQDRYCAAGSADVSPQLDIEELDESLLEEGIEEQDMDEEEGAMEMADEEEAELGDEG